MTATVMLPFPDFTPVDRQAGYREQAEQFAQANPELMRWWADQAFRYRDQSREIGMKALVEAARWEIGKHDVVRTSEFKINNNWTAHLARLLMDWYPGLDGFFATREIRHA